MFVKALFPCVLLIALLAGCRADSPALGYARAGYVPIDVGDNSYRVYTEETRNCVEVHRVNVVFPPPSRMEILFEMETAAMRVTGCAIETGSFTGDQAMSKGKLDCSAVPGMKDWVPGTCNIRPWG